MRRGLLLLPLIVLCIAPTSPDRRASFDFRYDVLPLLHRQGCGSAYCHGSATGRGGFKLSLFASDPAADHAAITRDLGGRRLDLRRPEHSLLLRKPSLQTDHGGGRRLVKGEHAHTTLERWIATGAAYTSGANRKLLSLELTLDGDRLRAMAKFADDQGEFERDVTELCTFTSSDDRVVAVDQIGVVENGEAGEAWLFARYVTHSARLPVVQPFEKVTTSTDTPHALDRLWLQRLNQLGLRPGSQTSVTTLARRLYLDLADRLPTPAELQMFRDRPAKSRVTTTAGVLVGTDEFATKFGRHLAEWMEIPLEPPARPNPRTAIYQQQHQRLVAAVRRGDTLHAIAERLIVTDGSILDRFSDPRDRSELAGRAFLGIRIGCARCHNSPIDKWEQKDHLAFSALFASPRPNPKGGMRPGILFDPGSGKAVTPRTLPVAAGPMSASAQPREYARTVADFVVQGGHGMFERNMANRTFAVLMGKGLVEPTDDHRLSNPAVHESLLAHLAAQMAGGDLRKLVLHIVTSRLYQTGSEPSESRADAAAVRFFARRVARTMPPAMFATAVSRALDTAPTERLIRSPLARQLALLNSAFLHDAVKDSGSLEAIARFAPNSKARLRDLFLLLLSREPRAEEVTAFLSDVSDRDGVANLGFAILAGREFGSIR